MLPWHSASSQAEFAAQALRAELKESRSLVGDFDSKDKIRTTVFYSKELISSDI